MRQPKPSKQAGGQAGRPVCCQSLNDQTSKPQICRIVTPVGDAESGEHLSFFLDRSIDRSIYLSIYLSIYPALLGHRSRYPSAPRLGPVYCELFLGGFQAQAPVGPGEGRRWRCARSVAIIIVRGGRWWSRIVDE